MASSGGMFDKIGNRYEASWTVRCLLDILMGEASKMRLEPPANEATGVEFWLQRGFITQYHQVKRQRSATGKWSISELASEGVLQSFWRNLDKHATAECVFVSTHGALELEKLTDNARQKASLEEYLTYVDDVKELQKAYEQLKEKLDKHNLLASDEVIFEKLKRIRVDATSEPHLHTTIRGLIASHFDGNPESIYDALFKLVFESVDTIPELSASYLWN